MLLLKEKEVCPYLTRCQYSGNCQGANPSRETTFTCNFVLESGEIEGGHFRNKLDQTGKMKIITEQSRQV